MHNNEIDVAVLVETWLNPNICDAELSHNGRYTVHRRDRTSRGGGVLILVKNIFASARVNFPTNRSEVVAVDIVLPNRSMRVIGVYLSPSGSAEQLRKETENLCEDLEPVLNAIDTIALFGDFNCPKADWINLSTPGRDPNLPSRECLLMNLICGAGMHQLVHSSTHRAGNILDLVFCNDDSVDDLELCNGPFRSDHRLIKIKLVSESFPLKNSERLNFEKTDYDEVILNLSTTSWETFFRTCLDLDDMYDKFVRYLWFLIEITTPLKCQESRGQISDYIRKISVEIDSTDNEAIRDRLRRDLAKAVKRQRILLESHIAKSSNSKDIFSYVKKRIVIKDNLSAIRRDDGTFATNDDEKAELLAKHFAKTYPAVIENGIESSSINFAPTRHAHHIVNDVSVNPEVLVKHLDNMELKLSTNPEGIPAYFYKKCGIEICKPLSLIFRRSLEEGMVPRLFQRAIVTPVHKKGASTEASNKRPVSLTVVPCKLLEKVICEAIYDNANNQDLIGKQQFAYRPGLDTTLQLLSTQCDWALMLNKSVPFDVVYFDFRSAFESVTHAKLIRLLPYYGVGPRLVNWIQAFLTDRQFVVKVHDTFSSAFNASSGCPQGTILGPLMFLLYINAIEDIIPPNVHVKIYADDVKIYRAISCANDTTELQTTLDKFLSLVESLDLRLSREKCTVLHFGSGNLKHTYNIGGSILSNSENIKDLGVRISTNLHFNDHINEVITNASRRSNWLLRSFQLKNPALYIRLFDTYIMPIITYASPVWYPMYKKDKIRLKAIQNKYISKVAFRCNVDKNYIKHRCVLAEIDKIDLNVFNRISKNIHLFEQLFDKVETNTRQKLNILPKAIAKKNYIGNLFPWRLSSVLHSA